MAGLGGLLGAYGSDEEEDEEHVGGAGQVTLLRDEESGEGDLDLSHLTSAQAKAEAESAERAPTGGDQQPSSQQQVVDLAAAPEAMDTDGQLQAAGGGGEQPPAAAEPDPMSRLPPEMREPPEGECDPVMQARVANWLYLQRTRGKFINDEIRKSRGYRNPEFFSKMVEHLEIEQYGTAFAPEVYDPAALPPQDYLDALQKEWAGEEERRKAARAAGQGRVEFQKSASQTGLVGTTLKPGLNQQLQQQSQPPPHAPPPASVAAAAAAAKASAVAAAAQQQHMQQQQLAQMQQQQQQQQQANMSASLAAAHAQAVLLAAHMSQGMQRR
ncbi:hypothetical protein D9Q98_005531 [Chlorella vulgaris]|uniref:Uncharacterized protein n=1 Tax=Chlorella vulgaris TaxID=3077 RepID=A0A9D4TMD9_CHLVU|nr:hypothetical protein D9Q98_005531 [Chlorella vulgaris]